MPHFFISSTDVKNNFISITDKDNFNHIVKSLRTSVGEKILLIDEMQFQYEGIVEKISNNSVDIKISKKYESKRKLNFNLYLAQSPLRSDAQSFVVEKATELGVDGIYPIYTANCALKKTVVEQKIPKWQKIMSEASKQCERAYVPKCFEPTTLEKLLSSGNFNRILAFTERDAEFKFKNYLSDNPILQNDKVLVIIGPEGGFSENEFEYFKKNNITTLSLGNLILKAETAVIAALGNIVL